MITDADIADWDYGPPTRDAHGTRLDKVAKPGRAFTYTYDFGDSWKHRVAVEKVIPSRPTSNFRHAPRATRRPLEDCGGTWGYAELLEILADPSHHEHGERREWAGGWGHGAFDPERFDPRRVRRQPPDPAARGLRRLIGTRPRRQLLQRQSAA